MFYWENGLTPFILHKNISAPSNDFDGHTAVPVHHTYSC